ncbi:MAG: RnfABCDGE type electron transport complex subunit G [bacterium]
MKSLTPLIVALTAVCLGAALALSLVNFLTADRIRQQEWMATMKAIRSVLPPFDNDPVQDTRTILVSTDARGRPESLKVYLGKMGDQITGVAFSRKGEGYGGFIHVMMGIDVDGRISNIFILPGHFETPGLGANIERPSFTEQFKGKSLRSAKLVAGNLAVDKDGGDIEAISGATISPRGVTRAVSEGLHLFQRFQAELVGPPPAEESEPQ